MVVLEENDTARAQIAHLWQKVKPLFAKAVDAKELSDADSLSMLKRGLGAFQLVYYVMLRYNF